MTPEALIGQQVALEAPDGTRFYFRVECLIPYAAHTYAVLAQEEEDGQMLVTDVEENGEEISFAVVTEEDIITAVMEKLVARSIAKGMEACGDTDAPAEETDETEETEETREKPASSADSHSSMRKYPGCIR